MKIAIHQSRISYSGKWIEYCVENNIPYKVVDCYKSDIIAQLNDCAGLMWHHYHMSAKDTLFAKQLLYAIESSEKVVYPDFRTNWHFDDKLGQKYLLEAINAPLVPSYAFYSKQDSIDWVQNITFPKVFKLRGGSGSANVRLVSTQREAIRLNKKAFEGGFSQYDVWPNIKERWRKYRIDKVNFKEVVEGFGRFVLPTDYVHTHGKERGYVYFQDFIPNNEYDIRVTYVFNRCFALRRKVRPGDFRASGSGNIDYDMLKIPSKAIALSFDVANKLRLQTAAFDFVILNDAPMILEVSYGFGDDFDQFNHGYWDSDLNYFPGTFNPYGWMVEGMINRIKDKNMKD